MEEVKYGVYSQFRPVNKCDVEIVEQAFLEQAGVAFNPLIVSTQIMEGTTYHFIGNTVSEPVGHLTSVVVFQEADAQKLRILAIQDIS